MATKNSNKADFKNLLKEISVQKEKDIPIQKVVPTIKNEDKPALQKLSLSLYVDDWMNLVKFKNYKILELKDLNFTMTNAVEYGLSLLEESNSIERNRDKIKLRTGKKGTETMNVKTTSIDINQERLGFINDYIYWKVFVQQRTDYSRPEFFQEMVRLIKSKHKNVFKS